MKQPPLLSELELYALLTILALGEDAYGVSIANNLETAHGVRVSTSAIYSALERLGERGFLSSTMGEATAERGGRAKRYFRVTEEGASVLRQTKSTLNRLWQFLPASKGSL